MSLGLQSVYQLDVILCFEVFAAILVELEFSCAAFALNCVFRPGDSRVTRHAVCLRRGCHGRLGRPLSWLPIVTSQLRSCFVTVQFIAKMRSVDIKRIV